MIRKVSVLIAALVALGVCAGCDGGRDPGKSPRVDALTRCAEAEKFLSARQIPEAMIAADEAVSAEGADDEIKGRACKVLSLCHTEARNSTSALAFAGMALASNPADEEAAMIYADALTDAGRYGECVDFLDSISGDNLNLRRRLIPALAGDGEWRRLMELTDSIGTDQLYDSELLYRADALAHLGLLSSLR
ncbi:MAG: hypothetical protein K2K72_03835, partial [Duncaniella sp.]|nr:hypothetical protein [Duncaniella sp.]